MPKASQGETVLLFLQFKAPDSTTFRQNPSQGSTVDPWVSIPPSSPHRETPTAYPVTATPLNIQSLDRGSWEGKVKVPFMLLVSGLHLEQIPVLLTVTTKFPIDSFGCMYILTSSGQKEKSHTGHHMFLPLFQCPFCVCVASATIVKYNKKTSMSPRGSGNCHTAKSIRCLTIWICLPALCPCHLPPYTKNCGLSCFSS